MAGYYRQQQGNNGNIIIYFLVMMMLIFSLLISSCSEDYTFEEVDCKEYVAKKYSKLIVEEAISNGWNPQDINVNTTDIFAPGFLDIDYDPNMLIFFTAYTKYWEKYQNDLKACDNE